MWYTVRGIQTMKFEQLVDLFKKSQKQLKKISQAQPDQSFTGFNMRLHILQAVPAKYKTHNL